MPPQIDFKPVGPEEPIDFQPIDFQPVEPVKEKSPGLGPGAFGMPTFGSIGSWLLDPESWHNKSVFGVPYPSMEELMNPSSETIQRAGFAGMTTPLNLAGELGAGLGLISKASKAAKGAKAAAPISTPPRRIAGLLPERTQARYLAGPADGPGQVALFDNATPEVEATLAGLNAPKYAEPRGTTIDLDEMREKLRLENLFFTDAEQAGRTRLDIPDKERVTIPAGPRETRLGFAEISRSGDLPYPLNVVPRATLPRSTQTVTRALAGDVPPPTVPGQKVEFESPQIEDFLSSGDEARHYSGTGQAIFGDPTNLPSAREVQQAAKNIAVDPAVLDDALKNAPPPVAQAISQIVKQESTRPSFWKSVYTEVKQQSEELYRRSFRAVQVDRQQKAQWLPALEKALRKLSSTEKANFGAYAEGKEVIVSPAVREAVAAWKIAENMVGDEAVRVGLRMYTDAGEAIPFKKNPNYWPRFPINPIPKKTLIEKLMSGGMSRYEAGRVEKHLVETGELIIGPQHTRSLETFPYKLDADIAMNHIRNMSRRIAKHKEFGPLDIKGKGDEGIADMIEATPDPEKTKKLMIRILGRDEREDAALVKALNVARKYSTITKLPLFTIPNVILGTTSSSIKGSRYPLASLKEASKLFGKKYRDEMQASGVWQDFATSLTEEIKPGRDWYGISAGETLNRGVAGAVGKAVAKGSFKALKANPKDKIARKEIFELLGEYADDVMKQSELSPEQLRMAAGRMAEKTQGLNVPGNLPLWASKPVTDLPSMVAQLTLIFKKMGYQNTKTIYDQVKTDPIHAGPMWLAASMIAGELVGDTKQGLRGLWTGTSEERIANRGSYWLDGAGITESALNKFAEALGIEPETAARGFDNMMQAFWLGLPADILMSGRFGPAGVYNAVFGPPIADATKLLTKTMDMNWKGIGRDIVGSSPIPVVGNQGLVDKLYEED